MNFEDIFSQITTKARVLAEQEAKLQQMIRQRKNNQGQNPPLNTEALDQFDLDILHQRQSMAQVQSDVDVLRHWAPSKQPCDLPDELGVMVLMYATYGHQQRLVRVCRKWKYLIGSVLDHVFVDSTGMEKLNMRWWSELERTTAPASPAWKYRCEAVRTVTFDADFGVWINDFDEHGLRIMWLQRFPNLAQLNLINSFFLLYLHVNEGVVKLFDSQKRYHIIIPNCFIDAFPSSGYATLLLQEEEIGNLSSAFTYYKRCPAMTLAAGDPFSVLDQSMKAFLCSHADTTLVAKYAPALDADIIRRMFDDLDCFETDGVLTGTDDIVLQPITLCESDNQVICQHRDVKFYQDHFSGLVCNLLQMIIRRLKPPTDEELMHRHQFYEEIERSKCPEELHSIFRCVDGVW